MTKRFKPGDKVVIKPPMLRFYKQPGQLWDLYNAGGVIRSEDLFIEAAIEFAISHGAPYKAKILEHKYANALVLITVGKYHVQAYFEPKDLTHV